MRDRVVFYRSFWEAIQTLPEEERLKAYENIFLYEFESIEPKKEQSAAYGIFIMAKSQIDVNAGKREAGCKGGRPSKKADKKPMVTKIKTNGYENKNQWLQNQKPMVSENDNHRFPEMKTIGFAQEKEKAIKEKEESKEKETYVSKKKDCGDRPGGYEDPCKRIELSAEVEAIPLVDGTEWRCSAEEYAEFVRLYPGVDIKQAFRDMRGWSIANPTRRKTARGIKRFVNGWLSREQDSPRPARSPAAEAKMGMTRGTDYGAVFADKALGAMFGEDHEKTD